MVGLGDQHLLLPAGGQLAEQAVDFQHKVGVGHRLHHEIKGVHLVALHGELGHVGHEDEGHRLIHPAQQGGGVHAAGLGKADIHEHQVVHRAVAV